MKLARKAAPRLAGHLSVEPDHRVVIGPGILLATLCCLLAPARSASAEGAWLLWGQTVDQWNGLTALPLGGWPSKDECGQERAKREEAQAELRIAVYNCRPDTVDPRGPKGK
jgi:hypothetical protein